MESTLKNVCTLKIENFEGPFDLLYHLIEKNKMNIYDIRINEITEQYMDYLYAMQTMDLEIASEFIVMAATLLYIKSKLLLPNKKEKIEEVEDSKEELIIKLIQYKKFKEFSEILIKNQEEWGKAYYKLPESIDFVIEYEHMELDSNILHEVYVNLLNRNEQKKNEVSSKMTTILQKETVSLRSKIRDVIKALIDKSIVKFADIFNLKKNSKLEIVTGFMAVLELAKMKRVELIQNQPFSNIDIKRIMNSKVIEYDFKEGEQ